jgi:type II secretory pathway component PulJ
MPPNGVGPTLADHEQRIAELERLIEQLQAELRRSNESHVHALESAS